MRSWVLSFAQDILKRRRKREDKEKWEEGKKEKMEKKRVKEREKYNHLGKQTGMNFIDKKR